VADRASEEGVQIALELISQIKKYHGQGIHGIHLMPVGWDEVVPRIVMEAGLMPKELIQNYSLDRVVPAIPRDAPQGTTV
jgi:methylenetetrahydrofolate reductase (NADPH)